MKPILTSEQMAASDRHTIEDLGVPGIELMERAARSCLESLTPELPPGSRVVVVTGAGNNGGDGFAIARMLHDAGFRVDVRMMFDHSRLSGDALVNYERLPTETPRRVIDDHLGLEDDVAQVVDAVFGTGLIRPAGGRFAAVIEEINQHPARVLAVDLPSGLSGSSCTTPGPHIRAHVTVSFQTLKLAHSVTPACISCGQVVVPDIGIRCPPDIKIDSYLVEASDYQREPRRADSHKGSFGSLAVIGGFAGMEGAANLCAMAALRFGAGKVRVLTDNPGNRFHHDSVMVDHINHLAGGYDAWIVGPGLSRRPRSFDMLQQVDLAGQRVVWDADGLFFLNARPGFIMGESWVMTPHPGEAAMLLGCSAGDVQKDRLAALAGLREKYPGGWILLKGYRTLISSPEGKRFICGTGNAALATAGSGDVLSGMIASLLAQGLAFDDAVLTAALRHGIAADRWATRHPIHAMIAEDIIDDLKYL